MQPRSKTPERIARRLELVWGVVKRIAKETSARASLERFTRILKSARGTMSASFSNREQSLSEQVMRRGRYQ